MKQIKPTAREARVVIMATLGAPINGSIYNDIRENGGRIKICGMTLGNAVQNDSQRMFRMMFPKFKFRFTTRGNATCIHYKEI